MKKLVFFAVVGVAVVAAVMSLIGTDVVHKKSSSGEPDKDPLATATKPVASVCSSTDYKEACVNSLGLLGNNQSATPKELIQAAINYTLNEVKSALDKSGMLEKAVKGPRDKMAVDDCQDLLHFAIDELQGSVSTVENSELHSMPDREADLRNWLSAVVSFHQTCIDGCGENHDLNETMSNALMNATQLTSNSLAIVSSMPDIFQRFNISVNKTAASRHLLEAAEDNENNYPSWLSTADRKLLASDNAGLTPNAVVAQDGSGQYKTIGAALAAYPKNNKGKYTIYVKAGTYNEYVTVSKYQVNVFMYGDGPRKTIVTGNKSNAKGVSTMQSATFAAVGTGFVAKDMGFQNTAGPDGHQAVALRSQSDMSAFYNCRIDGYQDTLYTQTHRQFYRNCVISGTVDFIFGDGAVIIQNSLIIVRMPSEGQKNTVTAQGRTDRHEPTGIVIQNCRIVPDQKLFPQRFQIQTFLGRPWKQFSMTLIMESTLADFIQPAGWMPWQGNFALDTLFYREYANRGPGADTAKRVKWKGYKVITDRNEVLPYTAGPFLQGNEWIQGTGAPFVLGLTT
ncbi:putative pectinesterase/pectinesterase inhibitor 13 [Apium graveolens]|uniref:putative pectinesterase/pectinesterase inhibitor 13 n=1 Tax=Apium graveolens TaxID=4045 RepID=UPI003D7A0CE9